MIPFGLPAISKLSNITASNITAGNMYPLTLTSLSHNGKIMYTAIGEVSLAQYCRFLEKIMPQNIYTASYLAKQFFPYLVLIEALKVGGGEIPKTSH